MLLFIDESGTDEKIAPCVVLGGVALTEENVWQLEQAVRSLQREVFGLELSDIGIEIKGKRLLKTKTFRHARQAAAIQPDIRRPLAREFLLKGYRERTTGVGENRTQDEFTAYGQAAIEFVDRLLDVSATFGVKTFGSIVQKNAPQPSDPSALRKDYNYLLERFFYYLESLPADVRGLLVCDELDPNQSQVIIQQISKYFIKSTKGQIRANRIVPVPFFVRSHLTTAIQIADVVCYVANWAVRIPGMNELTRSELETFGQKALDMQFQGTRFDEEGKQRGVFGFCYVKDLRTQAERAA
jgi:hypothetical protein